MGACTPHPKSALVCAKIAVIFVTVAYRRDIALQPMSAPKTRSTAILAQTKSALHLTVFQFNDLTRERKRRMKYILVHSFTCYPTVGAKESTPRQARKPIPLKLKEVKNCNF
jgi:hypothetical protein